MREPPFTLSGTPDSPPSEQRILARLMAQTSRKVTAAELLHAFFACYGRWDWHNDAVSVPHRIAEAPTTPTGARSYHEHIFIQSIERPVIDVAANASRRTARAIATIFAIAAKQLHDGFKWEAICGDGLSAFLETHETFCKIDITYWGTSSIKGRRLIGHLKSRFVNVCTLFFRSLA